MALRRILDIISASNAPISVQSHELLNNP